ncbi:hypothetical protein PSTG_03875 [Puccinia striiformis f. sp. tritici PST-78]|uniref:Uncharacterized protein n=1 Tax=Puccinia striiformis f. sp. tritici PST-78 TaxID=1165861 RepID=A0A0L0VUL8_9BASI|nr:hypothetical protein PSTG_03875 [Puccinia striiformis f. sp. tritici PST-78]
MAARKRPCTSMTTRSSTQAHQETPESESQSELDIAIVSTNNNSKIEPAESSPVTVTGQPKTCRGRAGSGSPEPREARGPCTQVRVWAHFSLILPGLGPPAIRGRLGLGSTFEPEPALFAP